MLVIAMFQNQRHFDPLGERLLNTSNSVCSTARGCQAYLHDDALHTLLAWCTDEWVMGWVLYLNYHD
jgi:hypothetical protein